MYGNNENKELTYTYSADFLAHFDGVTPPSVPLRAPPLMIPDHHFEAALKMEYGSPGSVANYSTRASSEQLMMMQRSISSHSLHNHMSGFHQLVLSPTEFLDLDTSPVRKVYSTGDLQGTNMGQQQGNNSQRSDSPLSNESSCSTIIEGVISKASPYSPEQKKERIEKYRTKRNHRNFNKKIKYECRKTLADSRPRIRGRFAKNEEIEKANNQINSDNGNNNNHEDQVSGDIEEQDVEELDDDNWVKFLSSFTSNLIP